MTEVTNGVEIVLCDVRDENVSVDEVLAAVRHPQCGGIALFVGVVRDHDHGEAVTALDYSAHPSAAETLRRVCEEVAARHGVTRIGGGAPNGPPRRGGHRRGGGRRRAAPG